MSIFLAGGDPTGPLPDVHDQFVREAEGVGERVVIAVQGGSAEATQAVTTLAEPILRRWPQAQIEPVWLVGSEVTVWPDEPERLAGVVVAGASTATVLDSLMPQRTVLARLVQRRVPYLGYSAGACVVGRHVITGDRRGAGGGGDQERLALLDGLGLIGPIVEPHADTTCLLDRTIAALQLGPATTALCLDDGLGLSVSAISGATRLSGTGRLTWLTRHGDQIVLRFERPGRATAEPPSEEDAATEA